MITFRLPHAPPSVNRAWRLVMGHMVRSAEFKKWEKAAMDSLAEQARKMNMPPLPELCYFAADIHMPRSQFRSDLDNGNKAIMDALARSKVTPDDRYAVDIRSRFWAGDYLIINLKEESLEKWQPIMKPGREILKRMQRAQSLSLGL